VDGSQLVMTDASGEKRLVFHSVIMGDIFGTADLKLPDDGVIYVQLMDDSMGDIEDSQIAEQVISSAAEFPIPFSLLYNPKRIIDNHTYTVVARIEDSSGKLLFTSLASHPVITSGNPNQVDVIFDRTR
jgi:putative lipoprotein